MTKKTRIEKDAMGEFQVPKDALYGASTQRAVENFPISHQNLHTAIIHSYGLIKWAAAIANEKLGKISPEISQAIQESSLQIYEGKYDSHFPVDIYQTGSGTSTNMNVNEVIANLCSKAKGEDLGSKKPVHPNDDVNYGQSSNDTFPTAIHIAVSLALKNQLLPALNNVQKTLKIKSKDFENILKIGRTHLMDATPIQLGQEFSGYARQIEKAITRTQQAITALLELPLGGTAVGTGINTHRNFAKEAITLIAEKTGIAFREAENHFEAQASKDDLLQAHGNLNTIATSFNKIANDIRLLNSGPRCGIGEILIPATQPGSSIMPGKVNPVMSEALTMVVARIFGNHSTVTHACANSHLQLNVYMPVLAQTILESVDLLTNSINAFNEKCLQGIEANKERCQELIEWSMSMITSLAPIIGYDTASKIAKQAVKEKKTIRQLCLEKAKELNLSKEKIEELLNPEKMTSPNESSKNY